MVCRSGTFSFAGMEGISANLAAYRSEYQESAMTVCHFPCRSRGETDARQNISCKTAAAAPARWFLIPITAIAIIHGEYVRVCQKTGERPLMVTTSTAA